jgi:hypothetical protein
MPDLPSPARAALQAHHAYITLQMALHAIPADHPATVPLAQLVGQAARHWQVLRAVAERAERTSTRPMLSSDVGRAAA